MELLVNTPALNVYEQMALDEAAVRLFDGGFWLRFYHWTPGAAVTFGYAQFANEVEKELAQKAAHVPYVRRPTGGGLVYHGEDLTFSCIFRPTETRPRDLYEKLHGLIRAGFCAQGLKARAFDRRLPASAYAPSRDHTAGACFVNPVENDLLAEDGRKILGGAIRRFGDTVLYQGSLQMPGARTDERCRAAVIDAVRYGYAPGLTPRGAGAELLRQARELARTRYQTESWIRKF